MGYYIYYTFPCSCTSTAGDYPARPAAVGDIISAAATAFRSVLTPSASVADVVFRHWMILTLDPPTMDRSVSDDGVEEARRWFVIYHYTAAATTTATTDSNNNNNNNDIIYIHDIGITQYNYSHNNYYASYLYTRSVYRRQFDWFPNADRLLQLCLIRRAGREVPLEIRTVRCLWFTRNICLLWSPWFPL